jgi:hypothetical protein
LVPNLPREDALRLDRRWEGKEGAGMIRRLDAVVPATVHCQSLVVVWALDLCLSFRFSDEELEPKCVEFKKDVVGLLTRHPKLRTLYVLDPMLKSSGSLAPGGYTVRFRGDGASFYEIDPFRSTKGWMTPGRLHEDVVDVFSGARDLAMLLAESQNQSQPDREIQVKVLACVPDVNIGTLMELLRYISNVTPDLEQLAVIVAVLCWLMVATTVILAFSAEVAEVLEAEGDGLLGIYM